MTMIVAYTWQEKIIMMADSRSSAKNNEGKMVNSNDEEYKIILFQNKIAIGHAGLSSVKPGNGSYFNLNKITERFLEVNKQKISKATGEELLRGLVEMWNGTLIQSMGRNPVDLGNRFSFLLAKFEENENGELEPKINAYQSHLREHFRIKFRNFNFGGNKAVIGDDEVYPIIMPYFETNTDDWTFDDALNFYKKGFTEVMEQVETVGGPIDIYVLDANSNDSHWLERKPAN